MTTLAIAINVTNPDDEDTRAMRFIIAQENARRKAFNSTTPPPVTPLAILPTSTAGERKTSYEICLAALIASAHSSYIQQSIQAAELDPEFKSLRPLWQDATPAKKAAALAALQ